MKFKKKFMISVASFVAVVAIAIVTIVAIFAAQNQGVSTSFSVRYNATNVYVSVNANYIVGANVTPMYTPDGNDTLVFEPGVGGGSLSPENEDIELDISSGSIVFEYIFTNNSTDQDVAVDFSTVGFIVSNMSVRFAYSYTKITKTARMATDDSFEPMMILGTDKENGDYSTLYVYVKASVDNLANDASFEGNMDFSLETTDSVKLTFENVDGATNKDLFKPRYIPQNTNIDDLPIPDFGDGATYRWFYDSNMESVCSFPLNVSSDVVLYACELPYNFTVERSGNYVVTTVTNKSADSLILEPDNGAYFSFGKSEYVIKDNEFIALGQGQQVVVREYDEYGEGYGCDVVGYETPSELENRMFYAAYGAYPQTYVGDELNATLKSASLTATGKSYTTDVNGLEMELIEYSYNGKKYASYETYGLIYQSYLPGGELIDVEERYFFYVEPIVAKSMQKNENGTYTMMSCRILGSRAFDDTSTFWETSSLRDYLNTTFLQESGLFDSVVETTIKNNKGYIIGGYEDDSGYVTIDKIWLASVEDYLNWYNYSGSLDNLSNYGHLTINDFGAIMPTDMSCATLTQYDGGTFNSGWYYLRTANTTRDCSCVFCYWEGVIGHGAPDDETSGFCPVFAVYI